MKAKDFEDLFLKNLEYEMYLTDQTMNNINCIKENLWEKM